MTVYCSLPYGCRVQLVGGPKNVELFVTLSAFLFKVVNSFFTVLVIRIFPMKFSEQANQGAIRLFKCSSKVSSAVPGKFACHNSTPIPNIVNNNKVVARTGQARGKGRWG